jgi:hypothetical protein
VSRAALGLTIAGAVACAAACAIALLVPGVGDLVNHGVPMVEVSRSGNTSSLRPLTADEEARLQWRQLGSVLGVAGALSFGASTFAREWSSERRPQRRALGRTLLVVGVVSLILPAMAATSLHANYQDRGGRFEGGDFTPLGLAVAASGSLLLTGLMLRRSNRTMSGREV